MSAAVVNVKLIKGLFSLERHTQMSPVFRVCSEAQQASLPSHQLNNTQECFTASKVDFSCVFLCIGLFCLHVQKRTLDPMEPQLQRAMSHHVVAGN